MSDDVNDNSEETREFVGVLIREFLAFCSIE